MIERSKVERKRNVLTFVFITWKSQGNDIFIQFEGKIIIFRLMVYVGTFVAESPFLVLFATFSNFAVIFCE